MNPLIVPHMQQQQPWNSAPTPSTSYVSISPKSAQQEQSLKAEDVWRARKKQKRNKPTLSCEECVERKTKVGARVLPSRQASRRRDFHCLSKTSLAKTRDHWEPFSQEIHLKFYTLSPLALVWAISYSRAHVSHHDATLSSPVRRVQACGRLHPIARYSPRPNVTTR